MSMIPYDVRSTVSRYSSCSEHSTTIHAFRSATNEGVSSRPMNDIRVLNLKQTKMTYFPKHRVLQKNSASKKPFVEPSSSRSWRVSIYSSAEKDEGLHQPGYLLVSPFIVSDLHGRARCILRYDYLFFYDYASF